MRSTRVQDQCPGSVTARGAHPPRVQFSAPRGKHGRKRRSQAFQPHGSYSAPACLGLHQNLKRSPESQITRRMVSLATSMGRARRSARAAPETKAIKSIFKKTVATKWATQRAAKQHFGVRWQSAAATPLSPARRINKPIKAFARTKAVWRFAVHEVIRTSTRSAKIGHSFS